MNRWWLRRESLWLLGLLFLIAGYQAFGDRADPCGGDTVPPATAAGHGAEGLPAGESVTVAGTVTARFLGDDELGGFFLQASDRAADAPSAVFVYAPGLDRAQRQRVRPGAQLEVRGTTDRFHGRPQVHQVRSVHRCGQGERPEPRELSRLPGTDTSERLEGQLVRYPGELVVTGNRRLGRYGSLTLAPERARRGGSDQGSRTTLVLDDGRYNTRPEPVPYRDPETGTRRAGDRVAGLTGIVTHAFGRWRLHPVTPPRWQTANPRPARPPDVGDGVRAVAFNVQNYFLETGERGAPDAVALDRQRRRLGATLDGLEADLLALQEIANSDAAARDLVDQMDSGSDYRVLTGADPGDDAIRTVMAYRPQRLELVAGPFRDTAPVHDRPPQAAVFQPPDGQALLAVSVHFKSKTRCPEAGDVDRGQGCWNARRGQQARAVAAFARRQAQRHDVAAILLLGDFNSYRDEDPMQALREAGFRDLVARFAGPRESYTYVYDGVAGTLDYALGNRALVRRTRGAGVWHSNADEPPVVGYQGRLAETAGGTPYRASDHDPVLVGIGARGRETRPE
ncbi:MAG: ExeM/NucH family extracellular endonuclease [Ectothiorhodospiraceae bacterium]